MGSHIGWTLLVCAFFTGRGSVSLDCGRAPLNTVSETTNKTDATVGSWPWQASLHYSFMDGHICGGTLINSQWILTAAHCILIDIPDAWVVYLGRVSQVGQNKYEEKRYVSKISIHPQYNETILDSDVALMKLSSWVPFTDHIRPICLAGTSSQFYTSTPCWATGWAKNHKSELQSDLSVLQQVRVPIIGNKWCGCSYLGLNESITDNMICAKPEGKEACQGYSGGPLQCKQNSVWIQAGIAIFGDGCNHSNYPEVYSRVSEFQRWISNEVAEDSVAFKMFTSNNTDPDGSFVCSNSPRAAAAHTWVFTVISVTVCLRYSLALEQF